MTTCFLNFFFQYSMERILDRYERYLQCEGGDVVEDHPEEMQVGI